MAIGEMRSGKGCSVHLLFALANTELGFENIAPLSPSPHRIEGKRKKLFFLSFSLVFAPEGIFFQNGKSPMKSSCESCDRFFFFWFSFVIALPSFKLFLIFKSESTPSVPLPHRVGPPHYWEVSESQQSIMGTGMQMSHSSQVTHLLRKSKRAKYAFFGYTPGPIKPLSRIK